MQTSIPELPKPDIGENIFRNTLKKKEKKKKRVWALLTHGVLGYLGSLVVAASAAKQSSAFREDMGRTKKADVSKRWKCS